MSVAPSDFGTRLRALVELRGAVLTEEELSHLGERYPRCRGKGHWDVREYADRPRTGHPPTGRGGSQGTAVIIEAVPA